MILYLIIMSLIWLVTCLFFRDIYIILKYRFRYNYITQKSWTRSKGSVGTGRTGKLGCRRRLDHVQSEAIKFLYARKQLLLFGLNDQVDIRLSLQLPVPLCHPQLFWFHHCLRRTAETLHRVHYRLVQTSFVLLPRAKVRKDWQRLPEKSQQMWEAHYLSCIGRRLQSNNICFPHQRFFRSNKVSGRLYVT